MPTLKLHLSFKRRYFVATAAVGLPLVSVSGAAVIRGWLGVWDAWTWAGLGVFVVGSVSYVFWQYRRLTRMRCPDCGGMIVRPVPSAGDSVNFFCRRCDVVWMTGLVAPSGD